MELDLAHRTTKKRSKWFHFTKRGLLNSNYKRLVKHNFKKTRKKSIFGIRQRIRSRKLSRQSLMVSMVLKVSVFVIVAILILF